MIYHPPSMTRLSELICFISARLPGSYLSIVRNELGFIGNVLDIGCGNGAPMYILAKGSSLHITGVDIFESSVRQARATGVYTSVIQGDVRFLKYEKKSFDKTISMFVLEHMERKEGISLLKKMEEIAKEKVIVVIPMGECVQHEYEGNVHQEHLSSWYAEDFIKRGYRVIGQGLNIYDRNSVLRKLLISIGPLNNIIFLFHILFHPFIKTQYRYARHLICVKDLM